MSRGSYKEGVGRRFQDGRDLSICVCSMNETPGRRHLQVERAEIVGTLQSPKGVRSAVPKEGLILARERGPPVWGQKGRKSG